MRVESKKVRMIRIGLGRESGGEFRFFKFKFFVNLELWRLI